MAEKKNWLDKKEIAGRALSLLAEYGENVEPVGKPPVPVWEIAECHLGLRIDFDDLRAKYRSDGILAEIHIREKGIVIDETLDRDTHPDMTGRFNFTLAHEIGHWVLHRGEVLSVENAPDLFEKAPGRILCRAGSREWHEKQADMFAAALLMPDTLVDGVWDRHGLPRPLNVYAEMESRRAGNPRFEPTCGIVDELITEFEVSRQALQIRLKELGYLDFDDPSQSLF